MLRRREPAARRKPWSSAYRRRIAAYYDRSTGGTASSLSADDDEDEDEEEDEEEEEEDEDYEDEDADADYEDYEDAIPPP